MLIIGIDPGIKGAICILKDGKILDVFDMPIMPVGKKNKSQVNGSQIYNEIQKAIIDEDKKDIKVDNSSFLKAITTVLIADVTMSLDNVLGVAGAARDHYILLIFGLVLSIALMATAATLISGWIKKYKWIAWVGLFAVLIVAIELIYTDIKVLLL